MGKVLSARTRNADDSDFMRRLALELDKLKAVVDTVDVVKKPTSPAIITVLGSNTSGGNNGSANNGFATFTTVAADGESISADDVVTVRITASGGTEAYLASAAEGDRPVDAVVLNVVELSTGVRRLVCTTSGLQRCRLASGALPTINARLFLSVTPGRLTDNPSESSSRLFEQDIGLFTGSAKNGLGVVQPGVALVDLHISRPSTFVAGDTV